MFKSLRDRFRRASKQAEAEIEPQLDLSYEAYRPEEREKGAVIQEKHLENVMWELELALLESDVAMEVVEVLKVKLQQRLVGLRVASRGEISPTIEKAFKASLVELLSLESFDPQRLLV
ncbi:MAG: signal recognition particle receptor subunit alpha, partial [Candidatus Thermoplasmatota archaeon]|nr:signal recognition particle receptor subunit alpha [Candidatus Thermoplasmatota archaeon]